MDPFELEDKEKTVKIKTKSGKVLIKKNGEKFVVCKNCVNPSNATFDLDVMTMNHGYKYRCKKCGFTEDCEKVINELEIGQEHLNNSPSCANKNNNASKVKDCSECSQPINEILAKCEEWEIKKQTKIKEILGLNCPHKCQHLNLKSIMLTDTTTCHDCKYKVYPCQNCGNKSIEACKCQMWSMGIDSPYEEFFSTTPGFYQECPSCEKGLIEGNSYGDVSPCSKNCSEKNKQNQDYLPVLIQILQYVIANDVLTISNQDDDLLITTPNQNLIINESQVNDLGFGLEEEQRLMWKNFKNYLNKTGKKSINRQGLEQEIDKIKNSSETKSPERPVWPWIIGGLVVALIFLVAVFIFRNKKNEKKSN